MATGTAVGSRQYNMHSPCQGGADAFRSCTLHSSCLRRRPTSIFRSLENHHLHFRKAEDERKAVACLVRRSLNPHEQLGQREPETARKTHEGIERGVYPTRFQPADTGSIYADHAPQLLLRKALSLAKQLYARTEQQTRLYYFFGKHHAPNAIDGIKAP